MRTEPDVEDDLRVDLTERPEWRRQDLLLSIGVVVAVVLVWLLFSPIVI